MAAIYVDEEEVWKCPKHPSKRRRNGICPACLRDRLVSLCPHCATIRPCPCAASSSSSSSAGEVEPSFRRSRSLAIPFLRPAATPTPSNGRASSFLSVLMRSKTRRSAPANDDGGKNSDSHDKIEDFARMVTRSRSVSTATTSGFRRGYSPAKSKFWNFPLKAFRSSKTPKIVVQDPSPFHRG